MTDKSKQQGSPESPQSQSGRTPGPVGQPAPEMPETERGGSHGAQSSSRINEDEGDSGES